MPVSRKETQDVETEQLKRFFKRKMSLFFTLSMHFPPSLYLEVHRLKVWHLVVCFLFSWVFYSATFIILSSSSTADPSLTVKILGQRTLSIWHLQLLLFPSRPGVTHLKQSTESIKRTHQTCYTSPSHRCFQQSQIKKSTKGEKVLIKHCLCVFSPPLIYLWSLLGMNQTYHTL